ncbi:MAG: DnaB-like helicase C-terminal domain-containing protein [Gemmatimonadaceae bacterium]|nr:DnaB-like helicase C-terminal domain-containing protein [Gemmatimonadaceae bacterium]
MTSPIGDRRASRAVDISPLARVMRRVDTPADPAHARDSFASGFPSIDRWLGGGLRRGDLIVIGGDVGAGKSALSLAMALRMAEAGVQCAFFTGEMSVERALERLLAIEGRVRIDDLRRGDLAEVPRAAVGAAAVRLRERAPVLSQLPMGGCDALAGEIRRSLDAQVVFVDSLQGLVGNVRAQEEELAAAVRVLKALAVELDLVVVLTSHVPLLDGRRPDPRPTLDDFGAQGAIKQQADVILGIFREAMYQPGTGVEGATEVLIRKNRNGSLGYVDLYFYEQWLRFEDMLDPDR